jgi:putative serine protease PepD
LIEASVWIIAAAVDRGFNTSIATLDGRSSGNIGVGFAVPIDRAADVAQRIVTRG